jgi:hypothetical protein
VANVTEIHTTYLPLVRFRSPRPLSSWVVALLAVLDSAALFLALAPKAAPVVPARLCLRSGFTCFTKIARAMGFTVPEEADPNGRISLSYQEFLDAVARMREVDFPIEREPADAWADFVGWRSNYEQATYRGRRHRRRACAVVGPRRHGGPAIAPIRPRLAGRPSRPRCCAARPVADDRGPSRVVPGSSSRRSARSLVQLCLPVGGYAAGWAGSWLVERMMFRSR